MLDVLIYTVLFYQGNNLSCTCVSNDKRWLATADIGQNSMVIVWDTQAGYVVLCWHIYHSTDISIWKDLEL